MRKFQFLSTGKNDILSLFCFLGIEPTLVADTLHQILKKYWDYASFRPMQEEIIRSVISGKDTLALLPTGGGKSICFQVPAMAMEGVCIVISPLIALMNDQVDALKKRGIPAVAINSALSYHEIDIALDNAVYGGTKFIYLSPERLQSDIIQQRLRKMKVSLLAVDEAHCISEWGFDFRPAYREIVQIREILPRAPVIALTATATPNVADDIIEQLELKSVARFTKSFVRPNLIYVVQNEKNKLSRIKNIVRRLGGSGIVYVPTRNETRRVAQLLRGQSINALPYHGGMDYESRHKTQKMWLENKADVVVSTNAFGMGIDKPDVRFVIHLHLPQSLEAYFQEAGRGGRDGQLSYAVALINEVDKNYLRDRVALSVPDEKEIIRVYKALVNHLQLALGSKLLEPLPFDLSAFAKKYSFNAVVAYNSLKILETCGYLVLSDAIHAPSRIQFSVGSKALYDFEVRNPRFEKLIHLLLRSYEGLFEQATRISENNICSRLNLSAQKVKEQLRELHQLRILQYSEQTDLPFISFLTERLRPESVILDKEYIDRLRQRHLSRMHAVIDYSENNLICRSKQLVAYFGESTSERCGKCDVCLSLKNSETSDYNFRSIRSEIENNLLHEPYPIQKLPVLEKHSEAKVLEVLRWMAENDLVIVNRENYISLKKPKDE